MFKGSTDIVKVRILPDGRMRRKDAALYLGLSPKTLANLAVKNEGPRFFRIGRWPFYFKDDLDHFIRGNNHQPKEASHD